MSIPSTQNLWLERIREATFKNWPFPDDRPCSGKRMAQAGFYACGGPEEVDLARCFLCGKELDGWEDTDDPWAEHRSHAAKCAFVQIGKVEDDLLVVDFLSILNQYYKNESKKRLDKMKDLFDEALEKAILNCQTTQKTLEKK